MKVERSEWQDLDSWVALDQVRAGLSEAVVEGAVEVVATVAALWLIVVGIAQSSVVPGPGNFPVENQVRLVFRPHSVEPF